MKEKENQLSIILQTHLTLRTALSHTATAREIIWSLQCGEPFLEEKILTRLSRVVDAAWSCRTVYAASEQYLPGKRTSHAECNVFCEIYVAMRTIFLGT